MVGAVSGIGINYSVYNMYRYSGPQARQNVQGTQAAARAQGTVYARRAAQPSVPVQPVKPASAVNPEEQQPLAAALGLREGVDPVEMAVRMRIRYSDELPGTGTGEVPEDEISGSEKTQSARETAEEGKCETCEKRKYQDGSDDPGVSFKTPTNISPENAASAVRGHENEHVVREQAKAQREDRKVVSQSVTYHTAICPECGKVYVSGGTTRTVTAANNDPQPEQQQPQTGMHFSAVA